MLEADFRHISTDVPPPSKALRHLEIKALHDRCGVYTKPEIVAQILDAVGWQVSAKLYECRLLEPAAGDGEFVIEAAKRLITSCHKYNVTPDVLALREQIQAFEIHPREARRARRRLKFALSEMGVHHRTANALAQAWIITGDFLLSSKLASSFTHTVGNPPYIRWSKIPRGLEAKYRQALPRALVGGDIFIPFLDRALAALNVGGKCGFICSDRWRYTAFAEGFRRKWFPQLQILSEEEVLSSKAFKKSADTYPTILIAKVRKASRQTVIAAPEIHRGRTLLECGYSIKVGPALGCTPAFVLQPDETDVEKGLLAPWIDGSEIADGKISWRGRRVAVLYGTDGSLIALKDFPMLAKRLRRFNSDLKKRSIVAHGAKWFQPIDRVNASDWAAPKLLVPEIAKIPRVALDLSGAIPSHGVYAIFASRQKLDTLCEQLADGGLAQALEGIAPKIKGGYVRCYKRFLAQIKLI